MCRSLALHIRTGATWRGFDLGRPGYIVDMVRMSQCEGKKKFFYVNFFLGGKSSV